MMLARWTVRTWFIAAVLAPLLALGQGANKMPRIGLITLGPSQGSGPVEAFRAGLRELGYIEGKTISLEYAFAEGDADRLAALVANLVRQKMDVIVTEGTPTVIAAKRATAAIPIVAAVMFDPVNLGIVASLSRPGGNVTGLTLAPGAREAKQLQLLKEMAPKTSDVAVIYNASIRSNAERVTALEAAGRSLGLRLQFIAVRAPADLDQAFAAVANSGCPAFITIGDGMLWGQRQRIVEFARTNRLPGVFPEREYAEAGGLMAYGPALAVNFRRAAAYVDKILKGAKPRDMPIEQSTKLDVVINMKTAAALGVKIPHALIVRADDVIQ